MSKRIIALLIILGCVLFLVGFYITSLDFGSCPSNYAPTELHPCYHTFEGTRIHIAPTGNMISFIGAVILVLTVAIFMRQHSSWWYKHGM